MEIYATHSDEYIVTGYVVMGGAVAQWVALLCHSSKAAHLLFFVVGIVLVHPHVIGASSMYFWLPRSQKTCI